MGSNKTKKKKGRARGITLAYLAARYKMSRMTFRANIAAIRKKLDRCVGRSNWRVLTPKQIQLIYDHLDEP